MDRHSESRIHIIGAVERGSAVPVREDKDLIHQSNRSL